MISKTCLLSSRREMCKEGRENKIRKEKYYIEIAYKRDTILDKFSSIKNFISFCNSIDLSQYHQRIDNSVINNPRKFINCIQRYDTIRTTKDIILFVYRVIYRIYFYQYVFFFFQVFIFISINVHSFNLNIFLSKHRNRDICRIGQL